MYVFVSLVDAYVQDDDEPARQPAAKVPMAVPYDALKAQLAAQKQGMVFVSLLLFFVLLFAPLFLFRLFTFSS